jgi:hypothetical protein
MDRHLEENDEKNARGILRDEMMIMVAMLGSGRDANLLQQTRVLGAIKSIEMQQRASEFKPAIEQLHLLIGQLQLLRDAKSAVRYTLFEDVLHSLHL